MWGTHGVPKVCTKFLLTLNLLYSNRNEKKMYEGPHSTYPVKKQKSYKGVQHFKDLILPH